MNGVFVHELPNLINSRGNATMPKLFIDEHGVQTGGLATYMWDTNKGYMGVLHILSSINKSMTQQRFLNQMTV